MVVRRLLPTLLHAESLAGAEPNRFLTADRASGFSDPLWQYEWWRADVGADSLVAPAPGVPITIIDSGVDLSHPEFQGAHISLLNQQSLRDGSEEEHGTAVTSVAAAPANGIGMVGIYPGANVWEWDAHALTLADVIAALDAVEKRGPSVINMSFGSPTYSAILAQAILGAFGSGSIIVAAAGNEGDQGNPLEYPASLPHVLTVAATDEQNRPTTFSNFNAAVDLAAPGQDIVVAAPFSIFPDGWGIGDGTSFSAPMVSAATAWVWNQRRNLDYTQVFDLMRFSAKDISTPGYDTATGFGLLDLPAALTRPAPSTDPGEPNDDIYMIKKNGLFTTADRPLTAPGHASAFAGARVDFMEDPEDVYRVYIPPRSTVRVRIAGDANADLELWRSRTISVLERGAAQRRDLIGASTNVGTTPDALTARNPSRSGSYVYADVFPARGTSSAAYSIEVTTSRR
jgi:subtilisin family serine protease